MLADVELINGDPASALLEYKPSSSKLIKSSSQFPKSGFSDNVKLLKTPFSGNEC
jgi:hypothetical protein